MPMIDVTAVAGTFSDKPELIKNLTAAGESTGMPTPTPRSRRRLAGRSPGPKAAANLLRSLRPVREPLRPGARFDEPTCA